MVASRSGGVGPMPLNSAKVPSPWRKKRSIGIMRSIALISAGGGATLRAVKAWRSGRRSSRISISAPGLRLMWPPSGRIWRSSSSARRLRRAAQVCDLLGHAQRRIGERDPRLQPRHAVARVAGGAAQIAHLPGQAAQEPAVEPHVGVVEDQRRLAEPGDDAARHDLGLPGDRVPGPCSAIHSSTSARALARVMAESAARRWRSQPKPSSDVGPFLRRRRHLERRAAVADHDLAGEREAAGIDFAGAGRVGGAQILRRDDEAVGLARASDHCASGWTVRPAPSDVEPAAQRQPGQPRRSAITIRDRQRAHPTTCGWPLLVAGSIPPACHCDNIAKGRRAANRAEAGRLSNPLQAGGKEAVEAGHAAVGSGQWQGRVRRSPGRR